MRLSVIVPLLVSAAIFLSACILRKERSAAKDFHENSRRRVANAQEAMHLAYLRQDGEIDRETTKTCAAFAVASTKFNDLIATAQHCADYRIKDTCGKITFYHASDEKKFAKCIDVVAIAPKIDIVIVKLSQSIFSGGLVLADRPPAAKSRIQMLGYPHDPYSANAGYPLLVTENCWIESAQKRASQANNATAGALDYSVFWHNCTTYGGNSGGPMLLEGSNIVVGLPNSYVPGDFQNKKWHLDSDEIALTSDFLSALDPGVIDRLGLVTANPSVAAVSSPQYLGLSQCTNKDGYPDMASIVPIYNSTNQLFGIDVRWSTGSSHTRYHCSGDLCIYDDGTAIEVKDSETLHLRNGRKPIVYSCKRI